MPKIVLNVKALQWGNSYGLRVTKADVERAGLPVGQDVADQIGGEPGKVDTSHLRTFRWGGQAGKYHADILCLDQLERMLARGSIDKAEFEREKTKIKRRTKGHVGA